MSQESDQIGEVLEVIQGFADAQRNVEGTDMTAEMISRLTDAAVRFNGLIPGIVAGLEGISDSGRKRVTALYNKLSGDLRPGSDAVRNEIRRLQKSDHPADRLPQLESLLKELEAAGPILEQLERELHHGPGASLALERQSRLQALADIQQLGFDPYPHRFERTHTVHQIDQLYVSASSEQLERDQVTVRVAGRIHAINRMGKAGFIRFTDGLALLQVYIRSNEHDERTWDLFKKHLHLGDFVGVEGFLFRTRTDELSIHAKSLMFLAKALLPPPDKYYGLHDVETRYRRRYADLIANSDVREVFERRSQIIREIRNYFDDRGYVEVETPMLTPLPTGAAARPFVTHHNALDIDLYARIAPELYLKRLIVGGFEKVYEINRNFRNEGISYKHNPEFTMLEWYQAYSDFRDLIELTEDLISGLVERVCGRSTVEYQEHRIDFTRPWKRMTMREAIGEYWSGTTGQTAVPTPEQLSTREDVLAWIERANLPALNGRMKEMSGLSYGYLLGELFEQVAEPNLINPTFIIEFPTELSPLSKQSDEDPRFVERFECFIATMEIANAFSEINDPEDQMARFRDQMKLRERGDEEAMLIDEDYIRALSYGMPPTAGEGVGIDRLVMILTNQRSIRDVILFPHMRPES